MNERRKVILFVGIALVSVVIVGVFLKSVGVLGGTSRKVCERLSREAFPLIKAIEKYKDDNGRYPDKLSLLASKYLSLEAGMEFDEWRKWHYSTEGKGYFIRKFTGRFRDELWYSNLESQDGKFGWYLDDDSGRPKQELTIHTASH